MLVDRLDFGLTWDYTGDITDPDDPEVKRARALAKREGRKPTPVPPLRAIAQRAPEVAELVARAYERITAKPAGQPQELAAGRRPGESKAHFLARLMGG